MTSLALFSADGKSLLCCSSDNRISLWETDTNKRKRVFVEKNHLAHSYSCFAWSKAAGSGSALRGSSSSGNGSSSSSSSSSSSKKQQQIASDEIEDILAVGCSDGTVIIWNLTTGVVVRVIGLVNESPVPTDLAISNDGASLFVSSQSSVVQYSLADGSQMQALKAGKHGALKIAMNPKANVLAIAGTSVKLVEVSSGRKRKLEAHLAGGVSAISFSQCGQYLAVSSAGVREVLIYDIQMGAGSGCLHVFAVDGVPRSLQARSRTASSDNQDEMDDEDGVTLVDVFAIFDEGSGGCVVRVGRASADSKETQSGKLEVRDGDRGALLAGSFCKSKRAVAAEVGGSTRDCLAYAVGTLADPFFGEVAFGVRDNNLATSVMLVDGKEAAGDATGVGASSSVSGGSHLGPPSILGPHEMGGKRRLSVGDDASSSLSSSSSKKTRTGSLSGQDEEGANGGHTGELTLEERLESLSAGMEALEKAASTVPLQDEPAPSSDSLVTLLDQGLQTGDDALIEQCLACDDADVVDATANRLPVSRVVPLLRKLVAKFEKRPARGMLLTRWLVSILRHHMAFLISVPDLSSQLAGLSQMFEQRLACHVSLASLGGRLDLLMSQVTSRGGGAGGHFAPKAVYHEE